MNAFVTLGAKDARLRADTRFDRASEILGRTDDIVAAMRQLNQIKPALKSRYLVKGWLDRGAFSVVYGESNVGKTFFAMDLALHVAAGEAWHEHRVPNGDKYAGPVLYIAAEGGSGINNRIEAMRSIRPDLMKRIEDEGNFSLLSAPLDLCTSYDVDYQIEAIQQSFNLMPSLIVIDTLARTMGHGDENTAKDMGQFVRNVDLLRKLTGAHVMVIHHSGKDASKGARGSGSLRAAADTEIELTRSSDVVMAEARKQRDMPCDSVFAYHLKPVFLGTDDDGESVTSAVVEMAHARRTSKRDHVSGRAQVALNALHDALRDKGRVIRLADLPNVPVVEVAVWQTYCDRVGVTDSHNADTKARTFRRHRDVLMDKNRIRMLDNYVWLTDRADNLRTTSKMSATDPDGHGHPPIGVSACPSVATVRSENDNAEFNDPNAAYWLRNKR